MILIHFSSVNSTNFANILENFAKFSISKNWTKKQLVIISSMLYDKWHTISNHVKNLVFDAIINLGFGRSLWMSKKGENECEYNK